MSQSSAGHIEYLINTFVTAKLSEQELASKRSIAKANSEVDRQAAAFQELVSLYGDAGREGLKCLLRHKNESVRLVAAVYLLRYCTQEAMMVLREIAQRGDGFISFEASEAIKRWEEGTWSLDLVDQTGPSE